MTIAQRHKFYKQALVKLKEIPDNWATGVCLILDKIAGIPTQEVLKVFTEYANKRPKSIKRDNVFCEDGVGGKKKRIAWLKECIEETKPKANSSKLKK